MTDKPFRIVAMARVRYAGFDVIAKGLERDIAGLAIGSVPAYFLTMNRVGKKTEFPLQRAIDPFWRHFVVIMNMSQEQIVRLWLRGYYLMIKLLALCIIECRAPSAVLPCIPYPALISEFLRNWPGPSLAHLREFSAEGDRRVLGKKVYIAIPHSTKLNRPGSCRRKAESCSLETYV